jgi:hypothetical protein
VTFDRDTAFHHPDAEFVSFGHPLFEAVMLWIESSFLEGLSRGAVFEDPDIALEGYIMFYEGEICDGTGSVAGKRLFAFHVHDGKAKSISPAVIWDLAEGTEAGREQQDVETLKHQVVPEAIHLLKEYKKELLAERRRQAEIKTKYGVKSLEHFIVELDGELIGLGERKERGENVDIAIRNKETRKQEYQEALVQLRDRIEREKRLTMSAPRFRGLIRVTGKTHIEPGMASDAEIERIGIAEAMKHETEQGRHPEDVSSENLGFDIRSKDRQGGIRYIEVKARAGRGPVALTQNEWFKARRFQDQYYLYAVMDASKQPELHIIQNPASTLEAQEKREIVRYIVPFEQIISAGKSVQK